MEQAVEQGYNFQKRMHVVVVGHVDHGKSTVVGRLLADLGTLHAGKVEQLRKKCEASGKRFEYAFLLDSLLDEQSQGITIDSARVYFNSASRAYALIDAPGHIEFLKNMVSGASHADVALLVIDASVGMQENSRRHAHLLSLLGVSSVVVVVTKMDLVEHDESIFNSIAADAIQFLSQIDIQPIAVVPVSGMTGENICNDSSSQDSLSMQWYLGKSILGVLDTLPFIESEEQLPFRMFVQDVYKFTKFNDDRRIVVGTVTSGALQSGDAITFFPSGKHSEVASFEQFPQGDNAVRSIAAGESVGFILSEQLYVRRGELACATNSAAPHFGCRIKTNIFWLANKPLKEGKRYRLKLGTSDVGAVVTAVSGVVDAGSLQQKADASSELVANCVANVELSLDEPIAFDLASGSRQTNRFVLVEDYQLVGGGIIVDQVFDSRDTIRRDVIQRNSSWINGLLSREDREQAYVQRAHLFLVSGAPKTPRKTIAKRLEESLFIEGRVVYYLGIGSLLHGLNSDVDRLSPEDELEHIRRLAEVAYLMLDAGVILFVSLADLSLEALRLLRNNLGREQVSIVWLGDEPIAAECDISFDAFEDTEFVVESVLEYIRDANNQT